jgi:hypothetical protein
MIIFCIGCLPSNGYLKVSMVNNYQPFENNKKIEHLKDGSEIESGYQIVQMAEYKSGITTINCSKNDMIFEIDLLCRKIGADAFKLYDIVEPNMITNTCFKAKVIILKKK